MKLSKKGQIKFEQYLYEYGAYVSGLRINAPTSFEFNPSDFKNTVSLTVEEAQLIFAIIEDCVDLSVQRMYRNLLKSFEERINQAEEGCEQ